MEVLDFADRGVSPYISGNDTDVGYNSERSMKILLLAVNID